MSGGPFHDARTDRCRFAIVAAGTERGGGPSPAAAGTERGGPLPLPPVPSGGGASPAAAGTKWGGPLPLPPVPSGGALSRRRRYQAGGALSRRRRRGNGKSENSRGGGIAELNFPPLLIHRPTTPGAGRRVTRNRRNQSDRWYGPEKNRPLLPQYYYRFVVLNSRSTVAKDKLTEKKKFRIL